MFIAVTPDMLFRGLFITISTKYYFGNPGWYMERFSTVDHWCPAYLSDLRTPRPLFCGTPPPPNVRGSGNGDQTIRWGEWARHYSFVVRNFVIYNFSWLVAL
jgi:hypothetical protein